MFCCAGFENLISGAGRRGIAALVWRDLMGRLSFVLQARAVDFADEMKLPRSDLQLNLNIASSTGLNYCPFCGYELQKLLRRDPRFFEDLEARHRELQTVQSLY